MILYHAGQFGASDHPKAVLPDELRGRLGRAGGWWQVLQFTAMPNVLVTLVDLRDPDDEREAWTVMREAGVRRMFLDSGAYTAWTKGIDIEFPTLYAMIDALAPEAFVQLDVIGDPVGTRRNLERMRSDGYRPIPVFTRGAPYTDLTRLLDEGERYICLGNIAKAKLPERRRWCRQVFAHTQAWMERTGEPLPKFHAFGVSQQVLLEEFPFYSCDSSAALMVSAHGDVIVFTADGQLKQRYLSRKKNHLWGHGSFKDAVAGSLVYVERRVQSVAAMNQMARHVTKVWKARGVEWDDDDTLDGEPARAA